MWHINLVQYLNELGFVQIESDKCVLVLKGPVSPNGIPALITIYVDDCMIMSSSLELINLIKSEFHKRYSIKDLGEAKWLLKIQIERMRQDGIEALWMGQPQYVAKLLDQFSAWLPKGSRVITTPMMVSWKHDPESLNYSNLTDRFTLSGCEHIVPCAANTIGYYVCSSSSSAIFVLSSRMS
jgi:hypothetical protein